MLTEPPELDPETDPVTEPPELDPETDPVTEPPELDPETDPVGVLDANTEVNAVEPPELADPLTTLNVLSL